MSSSKAALKAAKAAIDAHKYDEAVKEAHKALAIDSKNYHASVRVFSFMSSFLTCFPQ